MTFTNSNQEPYCSPRSAVKKDAVDIATALDNASPLDPSEDDKPLEEEVSNNPSKKLDFEATNKRGKGDEGKDEQYYYDSQDIVAINSDEETEEEKEDDVEESE